MSQRTVVVAMLREAGRQGVSVHDLIYRHGITRAAAIVFDLRAEGMEIDTLDEGNGMLARYVLKSWPAMPERQAARILEPERQLPPPAPLRLPCGCVRAADGRSWDERCPRHEVELFA